MKPLNAAALWVVLATSSGVFAQRFTVVCPTIPANPTTDEYKSAAVASPDSQPARCFFCGKVNKHKDDGTISDCTAGSPCPFLWLDNANPSYVDCGNLIDPSENGTLMGLSALESAEIRGWVTHIGGVNTGEAEWQMDILLDIGWMPNPHAPVTPLNAIDAIAKWLSPLNIAAFGYAPNDVQPFPQMSSLGRNLNEGGTGSMLGGNNATFGGNYSPVVHIEIDGWGPLARGVCDGTVDCTPKDPTKTWTDENAPVGWKKYEGSGIYWPFNVTAFQVGQYVRAVGTIWRDGSHHTGNAVNACWETARHDIGWTEMHNVDFMETADPPANHHVLAGYALCMNTPLGTQTATIDNSFTAPDFGMSPIPGASLVVASRHFGASNRPDSMIDFPHLTGSSNNNPNSRRTSTFVQVLGGTDYVWHVRYNVSATSALGTAYLGEWVEAYWNPCSSGQCPDSRAPGVCLAVSTSTDQNNCGSCANQCAPPLNGNGWPVCSAGACTFQCAYGYCPSSTDCIATALSTDVNNCGTCGNHCGSGMTCSAGTCACQPGLTNCGGVCTNLSTDGTNCGACGHSCSSACVNGSCRVCGPAKKCPPNYYWDDYYCACLQ